MYLFLIINRLADSFTDRIYIIFWNEKKNLQKKNFLSSIRPSLRVGSLIVIIILKAYKLCTVIEPHNYLNVSISKKLLYQKVKYFLGIQFFTTFVSSKKLSFLSSK